MENQIKQSRKQNWFQKHFLSRNSQDNRPIEGAYEAAVAAAAFAIQSVEEAKAAKLKSASWKENGRNGITSQFSFKKTKYAAEKSKDKPMEQKTKELGRVYSAAKPSSKSATIPIAPGDNVEWFNKLKSVVACGSDKILKTND
ncbi:uncharacterized protein LOC111291026 [Durio zibethinus]|uniref:Uncharacterized protein LOC111291026 n=1 Tax=Durio zibethinus TaxID=66656 RepID=A0A6P5YD77_DURZI|nr:uncharacterized protein LOC111291026 [Durio zibethinus]